MSLVASAHMRMKKKREKATTAAATATVPTAAYSSPSPGIISPHNAAASTVCGNEHADGWTRSSPVPAAPNSDEVQYGAAPSLAPVVDPLMRTPSGEDEQLNVSSSAATGASGQAPPRHPQSAQFDAVSSAGVVDAQHDRTPPADPPQTQQPHSSSHHAQQHPQHQHLSPPCHPPRPPMPVLGRRPAYGAGIGSHDTPPEEEGHNQGQWRQQQSVSPSPSQHSSQHSQRGISPSPSPQYLHTAAMRGVGPPPPPARWQPSPGIISPTHETECRHRYTHYLLPRNPQRVANRPRRRYDSFTGAPDDADEVDDSSVQQQQAFDPFAPSPLTLPNGVLNSDVHASHRASPLFHNGYPQHQITSIAPPNPGIPGLPDGSVNNPGIYSRAPLPPPPQRQDTGAFQPSPPQPPPPKGLTTIEGSNGIVAGFVYDDEVVRSGSYQEEDGEVAAANENANLNSSDSFVEQQPKNSLMNHYDFEYHTEKDEGSTFSGEGASLTNISSEGVPPPPPLPPDGRPISFNDNSIPPSIGGDPGEVPVGNQTVDSETALYGTPVIKKKHASKPKKRRGYRSKIIIDNVGKAHADGEVAGGGMDKVSIVSGDTGRQPVVNGRNPRHAMHYPDDENTLLEDSPNSLIASEEGSLRQKEDGSPLKNTGGPASLAKRELSAHVPGAMSKIVSLGQGDTEEQMLQPSNGKRGDIRLPPRLPISKRGEGKVISSLSAAGTTHSSRNLGTKSFKVSHESNNTVVSTHDIQFLSPPRIGQSKSWDSQDNVLGNKHVGGSGSFGSFAKNLVWDDDSLVGLHPDDNKNEAGDLRRRGNQLSKPSEMWDSDVNADEAPTAHVMQVESTGTWGTWGEQTASLFGDVAGVEAQVESDKENLFQQQDDVANERALAEWDRAEAEWRASTSVVGDVPVGDDGGPQPTGGGVASLLPAPKKHPPLLSMQTHKHHPWDSGSDPTEFGMFEPEPSVFSELTSSVLAGGRERSGVVKFSENVLLIDDEDSIFNFDKKQQGNISSEYRGTNLSQQHQQQQHQTKSIFSQINSSLKQADKTKSRALGIHPVGSEERTDFEDDQERRAQEQALLQTVQESPASETGSILSDGDKKNRTSGKRISFMERPPMVHTYLAPEESSESEKESDRYNDEEEDEESNMGNSTLEKSATALSPTEKNIGGPPGNSSQKQPHGMKIGQSSQEAPGSLGDTTDNGLSNRDDDTSGDSTLEDTVSYKSGLSDTRKGGEDDVTSGGGTGDDGGGSGGELGFIEQVEVGFAAVGGLLGGLFGVGPATTVVAPPVQANETKVQTRTNGAHGNDGGGGSMMTREDMTVEDVTVEDEKTLETEGDDDGTYGESTSTHYTERTAVESEYDWLGYMKNIIFPKDTDGGMSVMSGDLGTRYSDTYEADSTYQDDEDSYLLQQALAAARAIHHVQGVEYDETQEINVLTDIKFVVVTVSLPLGLLFQEHEIGVWVSRVVPDGNGARKGVQHGDQLAAINGNSSVHTTIDEVAATISSANSSGVELTFLRYVGPLRPVPGSIIQEGFEVTDTSVSPKREKAKQQDKEKSKRGLFSKKRIPSKTNSNSNNTPPSSPGRKFGLDISPKSPKRMSSSRASPKYISSTQGSSPKASLSATSASSSRASSSSRHSPSIPSLNAGQLQPQSARPTVKKKKSLGKLIPFKKKG